MPKFDMKNVIQEFFPKQHEDAYDMFNTFTKKLEEWLKDNASKKNKNDALAIHSKLTSLTNQLDAVKPQDPTRHMMWLQAYVWCSLTLGITYLFLDQIKEACKYLEITLQRTEELEENDETIEMATLLTILAETNIALGDFKRQNMLSKRALAIYENLLPLNREQIELGYLKLAYSYFMLGEHEASKALLKNLPKKDFNNNRTTFISVDLAVTCVHLNEYELAESYFEDAIKRDLMESNIHYASYLYFRKNYSRAIELLLPIIDREDNGPLIQFRKSDKAFLDPCLQPELDKREIFSIYAKPYAHFLLMCSYMASNKESDATNITNQFDNYVTEKAKKGEASTLDYQILGYMYQILKNNPTAETCIQQAKKLELIGQPDLVTTLQNKKTTNLKEDFDEYLRLCDMYFKAGYFKRSRIYLRRLDSVNRQQEQLSATTSKTTQPLTDNSSASKKRNSTSWSWQQPISYLKSWLPNIVFFSTSNQSSPIQQIIAKCTQTVFEKDGAWFASLTFSDKTLADECSNALMETVIQNAQKGNANETYGIVITAEKYDSHMGNGAFAQLKNQLRKDSEHDPEAERPTKEARL